MHDILEAEALALLAIPMICEDPSDWMQQKQPRNRVSIVCGLINEDGISTQLVLDFQFRRSAKTKIARYIFTIFKLTKNGQHRVYQLDVENFKVIPKDDHAFPHEHIGCRRINGTKDWLNWSYSEVLEQFCKITGVKFVPSPPNNPEDFKLKG